MKKKIKSMWICNGAFICDGFKWNICGCGFMKLLYAILGVELLIVKL